MRFIFFFLCSIFAQLTAATWSPPIDLPSSVPQSSNPVVAINSSGKAVAAWIENNTTANAAIFNGSTWTATSSIPFTVNVSNVQVVIDEAGNATALARAVIGAGNSPIEGAVLPSGSLTWSSIPDAQTGSNSNPLIGVDGLGNVFAIWQHTVLMVTTIQTAILNPLTLTWSVPVSLDSVTTPANFGSFILVVNSAGDALAAWDFHSALIGGNSQIRASSYSSGTMTWTTQSVNALSATNNRLPEVGIDSTGKGIAVWRFGTSLVSSNFNGITWSSTIPVTAFSPFGPGNTFQVAMDPSGNAWTIFDFSNNVYVTNLPAGAGSWTNQQQLNISGQSVGSSTIALNSSGAGLAVWEEIDNVTTNVVLVSALLNVGSTTWNTISPNITTSTSESNLGALAFSNNGTGVVDWINSSDVSPFFPVAQASFFPFTSSLEGMQIANRFLTQTDFVNILTWAAPFGFTPVRYNIFRDAALTILAGSVPAPTLEFEDHNRKKKTIYTYFIIAVDQSGNTRSIGTVTVNPNS